MTAFAPPAAGELVVTAADRRQPASAVAVANRHAALGFLLVAAAHYFFLSAGGVWPLPSYSAYFNRQAEAFARGQSSLLLRPVPGLLALPDPYDPDANRPYRRGLGVHDTVLYDGKLYLYWGPVPALLLTAVKPILSGAILGQPVVVGDEWLVLAFALGTDLAAALLLRRLWLRHFRDRSPAVIPLGLAILGLSAPATYFLARPAVYEAAIVGGQCFLLWGVWLAWRAVDPDGGRPGASAIDPEAGSAGELPASGSTSPLPYGRGSLRAPPQTRPAFPLFLAGGSLALAVGCRVSLAIAVTAVGLLVVVDVTARCRLGLSGLARLAAFGLPLVAAAVALGGYNHARFGSWREFGQRYQLTGANYRATPALFAPANAVPGAWSYLLRPPVLRATFPFVGAQVGDGTFPDGMTLPPNYETHETIVGLLWSAPAFALAGLPLLRLLTRRREEPPDLRRVVALLALAGGLGFAPILFMVGSTHRYLMDLWPACAILAAVGAWHLLAPGWGGRGPSAVARWTVGGLVAYGVAVGTLLGFTGYYDHFRTWNRPLYQTLGGE